MIFLFLKISSNQSIARGLFQLSRRDRECLPFSLMLRDEIENFFLSVSCFWDEIENFYLSVSCFETRSRISVFWSHASRRDREFLSFGLVLRDESEIFCLHSRDSRQKREQCWKKVLLLRDGFLFLAQWIIKRFQIEESSLCLKEYLIVLLRNTLQLAARNTTVV